MSSRPNHRRGHGRVLERGPRWENGNPAAGCNATHVARARAAWRRLHARRDRRRARRQLAHELAADLAPGRPRRTRLP